MEVEIKNCNNIDSAKIVLHPNTLNIKYGINGTGKTTLSKAIEFASNSTSENSNRLNDLTPFKYANSNDESNLPSVVGIESIHKVALFNESYINQYVFIEDEIIQGSFEIFIKDENYISNDESIKQITKIINDSVNTNADIDSLLGNLEALAKCFGKSKNSIAKNSDIFKSAGAKYKITHISEGLIEYSSFIQNETNNTKWLKWQMDGNTYGEKSDICPYCASNIERKKENILQIQKEYDNKTIEKLNTILNTVEELKEYLTTEAYNMIVDICKSIEGLSKDDENSLLQVRDQANLLIGQIRKLQSFSGRDISSVTNVEKSVEGLKLNSTRFPLINSSKVKEDIKRINESIDGILSEIGLVKQAIGTQQGYIRKTVEKHKKDINSFLKSAGYNYNVDLTSNNGDLKLVLKHNDLDEGIVSNAKTHLSFGEKNAFALILFMYEAIKNQADLIVLDDPISSFDKNKKYAIINKLFKGKNSFQDKTVLMLTHDFDPIVDMLCNVKQQFTSIKTEAYFLENTNGILTEKVIKPDDIKTFYQIAIENIGELPHTINKLIYLRRMYELQENKSEAYQLLSSLFKKRKEPTKNGDTILMTEQEISKGISEIQKHVAEFDTYQQLYEQLCDNNFVIEQYHKATSNYEKLQLYRIINPKTDDNVLRKFVNETYHLENDYLYQLNPKNYSTIPQYIVNICDEDIQQREIALDETAVEIIKR